jgi:hypothetical protein
MERVVVSVSIEIVNFDQTYSGAVVFAADDGGIRAGWKDHEDG